MLQCYNVTMLQCYNVTMLQCYNVTMLQCICMYVHVTNVILTFLFVAYFAKKLTFVFVCTIETNLKSISEELTNIRIVSH